MDPAVLKNYLKARAAEEGFSALRVTRPDAVPHAAADLAGFLANNHHGTMEWMRDTFERRSGPANLWADVRSVIMVAAPYGPDHDPLENLRKKRTGNVSVYARGKDYHDVIKGALKRIAGDFARKAGAEVKVFTDTAPVMEKPLAMAAGLGWQGKHTNLVSQDLGSWFFLGSIFTTAELEPDTAESDHCGSCRRCLDICPTGAFPAPYRIDARRCISYLTIEHKGPVPEEFRKAMGNRIYGCDDCLAACPWNKFAESARDQRLAAKDALNDPDLETLLSLDDPAFRVLFQGTPVKRTGYIRLMRNILIAAGNSGDPSLVPAVEPYLSHPDPLLRGAAVWALGSLLSPEETMAVYHEERCGEDDPVVKEEWSKIPARNG